MAVLFSKITGRRFRAVQIEHEFEHTWCCLLGFSEWRDLFVPWLGQFIALHASPTARDLFLANFYFPGPFTFIFFTQLHLGKLQLWLMQVPV